MDTNDFAEVVQEVVDREDWVSENALMIVVKYGSGSYNYWRSLDTGGGIYKPELHITYCVLT